MDSRGILDIHRFILTHPDMDHMDGIKDLFDYARPTNFWDTNNNKECDSFGYGSPYREEDWNFYKALRDNDPDHNPKRLALLSGARAMHYNMDENGDGGGDGLHILSPTQALVDACNECDEYNDLSFVILYRMSGFKILFTGDACAGAWEHIIDAHSSDVEDVDLLIAPHHGRKAGQDFSYLDTLNPKMTFFGNARSEHLAYSAWNNRDLEFVTNNQAGSMLVETDANDLDLYVTNENYARASNPDTFQSEDHWFLKTITST